MAQSMPISEIRQGLSGLVKNLNEDPDFNEIIATRNGKPVIALLNYDLYESLMETLEIYSDPEMVKSIRQGIADIKAGRVKSLEEVERELGL